LVSSNIQKLDLEITIPIWSVEKKFYENFSVGLNIKKHKLF
jgi:hypothetical protein